MNRADLKKLKSKRNEKTPEQKMKERKERKIKNKVLKDSNKEFAKIGLNELTLSDLENNDINTTWEQFNDLYRTTSETLIQNSLNLKTYLEHPEFPKDEIGTEDYDKVVHALTHTFVNISSELRATRKKHEDKTSTVLEEEVELAIDIYSDYMTILEGLLTAMTMIASPMVNLVSGSQQDVDGGGTG